MHIDQRREGVDRLGHFTRLLVKDGVTSREAAKRWRSDPANVQAMADLFRYEQQKGAPAIGALVGVDFNDELGLVKYNYTGAAHNTLHAYPEGWTPTLRMCRGSAFAHDGTLVAHAFPKFFNRGEHPETISLPDEPWVATDKKDGHLGINFAHRRNWHVTTRGSFDSPSSKLGAAIMTRERLRTRWRTAINPNITVLVEIIDPATKVHVDYGGQSGFVLIGAYDRVTLRDFAHDDLVRVGAMLDIPVTERYQGTDLNALFALMEDLSARGHEGFVVRFEGGLRMKIKFATYINLMVEAKLSPKYLMQRIVSGNLDRMIKNLDFEVLSRAHEMLGRIDRVRHMDADAKARAHYLHGLVPPEECTAYYKDVCRAFLRHIGA